MSHIFNYPTGQVVKSTDYNNVGTDILQRLDYFRSVLPIIYWGLDVELISPGLTVKIHEGTGEGNQILLPNMNISINSHYLPATVVVQEHDLIIPANSTGWIVLNVVVSPSPSTNSSVYNIGVDDGQGNPFAVFVTQLNPPTSPNQIVLAKVVTNATTVTSIDQTYNPPTQSGTVKIRDFDLQRHLNLFNNGSFDVLNNNGNGTISIPGYINNLGTNNQLPIPTLSWKYGKFFTQNNGEVSDTQGLVTLSSPFQNKILFAIVDGIATGIDDQHLKHSMPVTASLNTSNVNSTFFVGTNPPLPIALIQFYGNYLLLGY